MMRSLEIWEKLISERIGLNFSEEKTNFGSDINILVYIGRIGSDQEYSEINLYVDRNNENVVSAFWYSGGRRPEMNIIDFEKTYRDFFIESEREMKINTILE